MKLSHEETSDNASQESRARAQQHSHSVAGEIRNDSNLTATLIGVTAFPAAKRDNVHDTLIDGQPFHQHGLIEGLPMFVTPATVDAISKAKRRATEPSIKVNLDMPFDQQRADAYDRDRVERADAFARVRAEHAPTRKSARGSAPILRIARNEIEAPTAPQKWEQFEDLGLAPKPITKKAQKLVVSSYRLLGFGILTLIVVVLLGYIGTTAFYFLNRTWVTPVAISAMDEKVVTMQGQLAAQLNEREKLVTELADSERAIAAEQTFQLQFAKSIKKDADGRRLALGRVQELAGVAAATRSQIRQQNELFSREAASKMENDYNARLVDYNSMIAGKQQLAQISSANLSLAERQAEFDQRAAELSSQTRALDALLSDKSQTAALSYDVLKIARNYETSKLALARELGNRERLTAAIGRQQKIIDGLEQSAYLRAVENGATVAMVPYKNLHNVSEGTALYACKLQMLMCREVGKVVAILPGEVTVKHPDRDTLLRGRMIEMQMSEPSAAQKEVLFLGGAPLGI